MIVRIRNPLPEDEKHCRLQPVLFKRTRNIRDCSSSFAGRRETLPLAARPFQKDKKHSRQHFILSRKTRNIAAGSPSFSKGQETFATAVHPFAGRRETLPLAARPLQKDKKHSP